MGNAATTRYDRFIITKGEKTLSDFLPYQILNNYNHFRPSIYFKVGIYIRGKDQ